MLKKIANTPKIGQYLPLYPLNEGPRPERKKSDKGLFAVYCLHMKAPTATSASKPKKLSFKKQTKALKAELGIEDVTLGMMPRIFAQATLPHSKSNKRSFTRKNGNIELTMIALGKKGNLPYGVIPRVFLAWIAAEVKKTGSRTVYLGGSLRTLTKTLGFNIGGGTRGEITRLNDQLKRLFNLAITLECNDGEHSVFQNSLLFDKGSYNNKKVWEGSVTLSEVFFKEAMLSSIPVDFDVLKALRSPMAMDIYVWLTHRMSYLACPMLVKWEHLHLQFGADYSRERDFRVKFKKHLATVLKIYVAAKVEIQNDGILLKPSSPHVIRSKARKKLN